MPPRHSQETTRSGQSIHFEGSFCSPSSPRKSHTLGFQKGHPPPTCTQLWSGGQLDFRMLSLDIPASGVKRAMLSSSRTFYTHTGRHSPVHLNIKIWKSGVPTWFRGLRIQRYHAVALATAVAQVRSLAWELPHAVGAAKKKKINICCGFHYH